METNTVTQITTLRDSIAKNLEVYRKNQVGRGADMNVGQFGSESEYSINGLIGGVKNILTDISYLVNAHNIFIKLSTYAERSSINSNLSNLNSYIQNANHSYIASYLDELKVALRGYNLRSDKNRYLEFSNEIDNLRKTAISLEDAIGDVKTKLTESETIYSEIGETKEKYDATFEALESEKDTLLETVSNITSQYNDFKALAEQAEENEVTISEKLELVQGEKKVFDEFIAKITERELQLKQQKDQTVKYNNELEKYAKEHSNKLIEAQDLITKSYIALQYCTAEGISAAFQKQHDKANDTKEKRYWLLAAGGFMILTILLGVWIVGGWWIQSGDKLYSLIGRLSMIPFTILGALFCANQYTKQKNIAEDYAYKTVLAKSIVAFSEELREKDQERYAEYISTVLREIHQDPLRKRSKEKDEVSVKDSAGLIEKMIELLKAIGK